ncbi:hypothetical protein JTE90_006930 [Oedothorax gibbosus]|uniref:Uncharacterized protein n=1 Tax=Oedothorax gibbosus TaxID=931172 RepID=A0AAV6VPZ7_9ARAC|nr:hypothetical protein JTE90_006930 [Oedothorax gibbosus]
MLHMHFMQRHVLTGDGTVTDTVSCHSQCALLQNFPVTVVGYTLGDDVIMTSFVDISQFLYCGLCCRQGLFTRGFLQLTGMKRRTL